MQQRIILRKLDKPVLKNPEGDIFWLCDSFGFTSGRDIEDITSRTIYTFLRRYSEERAASSDELAEEMHVSPSRINYHVRGLIESGFLYRNKRLILLRAGSLKAAVEELRKDANRIFDELSIVAEEIDSALGLKSR